MKHPRGSYTPRPLSAELTGARMSLLRQVSPWKARKVYKLKCNRRHLRGSSRGFSFSSSSFCTLPIRSTMNILLVKSETKPWFCGGDEGLVGVVRRGQHQGQSVLESGFWPQHPSLGGAKAVERPEGGGLSAGSIQLRQATWAGACPPSASGALGMK